MNRPIKILFLAANPKDTDRLRLDEEIRGIDQALLKAEFRDKFEIKQHWAVRVSDLQSCLLRHQPHIVHFSGHGNSSSEIVLEDKNGNRQTVPTHALNQLFSVLKDNIRCVVLNACYSEQQAQAISEHVDFVIGMSTSIGDTAAISFSIAFYQALGYGKDVATAFDLGCVQIGLENLSEQDAPKLLIRSDNKKIFPDPTYFAPPPPLLSAPEAKDLTNLQILLNKVNTFWIEGVLEKSVHDAVLLELGKEIQPKVVEHPWEMILELPDQANQTLPANTRMIDVFDRMNRTLLILGEPGSGKTITLLELTGDLIIRAEADPTQPIPVVFNLSSWDKHQTLYDWLVIELNSKYQIPKRVGKKWLEDNRILPLLDGFDEVESNNRSLCVKNINRYGEIFGLAGLVICSRVNEYTSLNVRLRLNGAVRLLPLDSDQIDNYLTRAESELSALRRTLQKDINLQVLAQSPLMLSVMSLAYKNLQVLDLKNYELDSIDVRRKHIFDNYVDCMLTRKGGINNLYSKNETKRYLSWLAKKMVQHSRSVFLIEQIQPSWLSSNKLRWIYALSSRSIVGLSIGIFLALQSRPRNSSTMDSLLDLILFLILSLLMGIMVGLPAGLIDALRFKRSFKNLGVSKDVGNWQVLFYIIIYASMIGTISGLLVGISLGLEAALIATPVSGLFSAFTTGLLFGLRIKTHNLRNDIQPVENLNWSWQLAFKGFVKGMKVGSIFGLFVSMLLTILGVVTKDAMVAMPFNIGRSLSGTILGGLVNTLMYAVLGGFIGLLWGGLKHRVVESKTKANQGIKLSLRNALRAGLVVGVTLGLAASLGVDIFFGLYIIILSMLWFGGIEVIQHYTLRTILYREKHIPRKYAGFLDHACKLIFLQKVGGGYIFIHRFLLEHFATLKAD